MVTNDDIREYIFEKYNFKAKNAWIAHAKEVYGLPTRRSNRESDIRKWPCPKKRLEQIREAFVHFKLLDP